MQIREINPESAEEIELVACRMRQTLVEVLGETRGAALYSMEWLRQRVCWHLHPQQTARIYVAQNEERIIGHAIVRIEHEDDGTRYGYFSTIFVEPASRNKGVASALAAHVEAWLQEMKITRVVYNTGAHHAKLISLFERRGYRITVRDGEMFQLTKHLGARSAHQAASA